LYPSRLKTEKVAKNALYHNAIAENVKIVLRKITIFWWFSPVGELQAELLG